MTYYTFVTGASEGIGREFARIAARKGRNVILTARSVDKLEALADDLRAEDVDVVVIPADLSTPDAADTLFAEAVAGRGIDVFINNAGLGHNGAFADPDGWPREEATITVNVLAATRLLKLMLPHMTALDAKARIVNVASVAGFVPGPGMAVYHASKAYLLSLSEAVAHEMRGSNVTVTALCPGPTRTNFFEAADMKDVAMVQGDLPTAYSVALAGWDGAVTGTQVVVPGATNKMLAFLPRIAPRTVIAGVASRFLERS
ncbi:MAG: SDR family oxidoreductase [Pseudomonadota bacterium]